MQAWVDLFSTDYGIMSVIVIAGVIAMSVYFSKMFKQKMEEDERAARK
jgi:heme/copper-type cytochrome/quinol oxidase subunit 2